MFEKLLKLFKKGKNGVETPTNSKSAAKERLHLVLMQDRANVSADFLDLMKQEIIEVIKKYIEVDESAIDVRLTNKENEDGTNGAPALYANIPILNIKNEARKVENKIKEEKKEENKTNQKENVEKKEEDKKEVTENQKKLEEKKEENKKEDDKSVDKEKKNEADNKDKNDKLDNKEEESESDTKKENDKSENNKEENSSDDKNENDKTNNEKEKQANKA